jgi:hypothetical protein
LVLLEFELSTLCLLHRHCTTQAMPSAHVFVQPTWTMIFLPPASLEGHMCSTMLSLLGEMGSSIHVYNVIWSNLLPCYSFLFFLLYWTFLMGFIILFLNMHRKYFNHIHLPFMLSFHPSSSHGLALLRIPSFFTQVVHFSFL